MKKHCVCLFIVKKFINNKFDIQNYVFGELFKQLYINLIFSYKTIKVTN